MGKRKQPISVDPFRPGLGTLGPVWAVLAVVVGTAFAPTLDNGFVDWDDRDWIVDNQAFRRPGWEPFHYAFTTMKGGVYQPLGWLCQDLTYLLFGLDPRGFHLVSLAFHVANVVLLHLLCVILVARAMPEAAARLGRGLGWLCAIPVGLYAVHPLRVEMVAWASPQAYLPSLTLSLLATLAYLRAQSPDVPDGRRWRIASSLLVVLAVLTKGSAVVLPFVFLILDAYPLGPIGAGTGHPRWPLARRALIEKTPILAFCLAFTVVAFVAKQVGGVDPEATAQPMLVARVAQACFGAWFYLAKTIWPFGISPFYPRPEDENFLTPLFGACVVGLILAVASAFWQRKRRPWLASAMAAYLVIASPYLGLARVSVTLASDRYAHAASMAWVVLACAGLCRIAQRRWSRGALLAAGAGTITLGTALMALGSAQCRVWKSNEHLWQHALACAPWSSQLHDYMGATFAELGETDRAIAEFREALRIRPDRVEALSDLGAALDGQGQIAEALDSLEKAHRLRPELPRVSLNLGSALVHAGRVDEAIALYREALRLQPAFANLHFNLGVALLLQRRVDEGIAALSRAVELRPAYAEAYAAIGGARVLQNRQNDAVDAYRQAVRLDPDHSAARIGLGLSLARTGRVAEAVAQLEQAVDRDPRNPEAHHVLGAVLAAAGRPREAAAEFEQVLRLRPDHARARIALAKARGQTM